MLNSIRILALSMIDSYKNISIAVRSALLLFLDQRTLSRPRAIDLVRFIATGVPRWARARVPVLLLHVALVVVVLLRRVLVLEADVLLQGTLRSVGLIAFRVGALKGPLDHLVGTSEPLRPVSANLWRGDAPLGVADSGNASLRTTSKLTSTLLTLASTSLLIFWNCFICSWMQ